MLNFNFYNPTHVVFGKDRLSEIATLIPENAKVLIIYGGGSIKKFGTFDKIVKALESFEIFEFGGIEPNPQLQTCIKAAEYIKENNIDFILAVGGGSVLDATKYISIAAKYYGNDYKSLIKHGFTPVPVTEAVPFGTVLTLPATGSEMNAFSVISDETGKYAVYSPLFFPKFSFLDPTLTYTLPKKQVANGIVDTFIHVVEQYITFPVDAKFQDRAAEGILQTLVEIGDYTLNNPEDYDARANFMWCATMALNGVVGSGVPQDWSTHMIGHEFTAKFDIDHGRTLAMVLPSLLRERKENKKAKLLQYAERVWGITEGNADERIEAAIQQTENFFNSLGVPTKISDYSVKKEELKDIITQLESHGMVALSETGDLTLDVAERILENAY
ncbi:iron-containing alcohol dehydrogenase [Aquimarina sp. D1M17]|uniref:iron-containing alcohol dehydrogenase n=1 Tax=Aquimarina acroporae TaxID=2937283 RepID=UPI0020C0905F|nr:iron-containing alcohol dehydrogenase [Aquimarina acroporae]MCK8523957.1 iron-containing alcohol dehydrogenase [Aquimarina acroporae]